VRKSRVNPEAARAFYKPLAWLAHNTAMRKPLRWYLGLWDRFDR
jgi:hypothetical protein